MTHLRQKVGVIGGGQLAWMMAIAACELGVELIVLTEHYDDPATGAASDTILGELDDPKSLRELALACDVITFENEFVDLDLLGSLAADGVIFCPALHTLATLVDKYDQRNFLQAQQIPIPAFFAVNCQTELIAAAQKLTYPLVLKARRHGYDGKGTWIINSEAELLHTWAAVRNLSLLLEAYVPFDQELAVIIARNQVGESACYAVVETVQINQVCHRAIAPAQIDPAIAVQIQNIAKQIADSLQFIGVLGIEFFLTPEGKISVNEIAPRTHNSGHFSIEACYTSQFSQLVRIASGRPLGNPEMQVPFAVMINLLGYENKDSDYAECRAQLSQLPRTFVHWYGKNQSKPGRKLGHVTVLGEDYQEAIATANLVEKIWYGLGK